MQTNSASDNPTGLHSRLSTTTSLIVDLKAMSPDRWQNFILVYSPLLRFWIRRKSLPEHVEDDVLQECLRTVFTGIHQFEKDAAKGTFRGWLRTIVYRRVADHFRQQLQERPTVQDFFESITSPSQKVPDELQAEQQAIQDLEARALELVRSTTTEKTWQMFWQSTIESVPTAEVASKFGVSQAAVRVAKGRVLQRLKELMVDDLGIRS